MNDEPEIGAQPPEEAPAPPPASVTDLPVSDPNDLGLQLLDALELLEYAVESGFRREDGSVVAEEIVVSIKRMAARFSITRATPRERLPKPTTQIMSSEWIAFELAYQRLSVFMSPVTAQTVRDTRDVGTTYAAGLSPAQSFSRRLSGFAVCFAAYVVAGEWGMQHYGPVLEGESDFANAVMQLVQILIPYAYGGLGACAYLLRSAHQYIYLRSFDLRRKPEYTNRILLGTISGGAIILFVERITTDDGVITLSSAALGFIAGYSTDFLFSAIERVVGAVLPKVGVTSMRRADVVRASASIEAGSVSLKDLLERLERAKDEKDRLLIRSLLEKLKDRL